LFCLLTIDQAYTVTDCWAEPPNNPPERWSWRMIDGRQCWYQGERMRAKGLLRWAPAKPAAPAEPAAVEIEPVVEPEAAPEQTRFNDRWDPVFDMHKPGKGDRLPW
jgi:hypothetical protein